MRSRSRWLAPWAMLVFVTVVLASGSGCSADNSAGAGGTGGVPDAVGDDVVETSADTIHDPTWDLPEALIAGSPATACTSGPQCPTGNCVDGFCCDQRCDNKCMACSAAK
ncbi:MAG TPA: hypothetical protein PK156_50450, partial [Polyangium sp.]|nr:hypothetical protein [Polyangium sp.]